jgi:drug/metabolite transporter (DMT)-like permease
LIVLRKPLAPPPLGATIILGLLQTFGFTLFQTLAVATGSAGKTAILVYTMPFWTVLLATAFLGERIRAKGAVVLALAAVGLVFVLWPLDLAAGITSKLLALASALSWAGSAVYAKHFRAKHQVELLSLTTWQMAFGSIPLVLAACFAPAHHVRIEPAFIAAMSYLVVFGTAAGWMLWLFILNKLSAGGAGISGLLVPVVGVLAAWVQLGDSPSITEAIGLGLIVIALVTNILPAPLSQTPKVRTERA